MSSGVKIKRKAEKVEGREQRAEGKNPVEKSRGREAENTASHAPRTAPQKQRAKENEKASEMVTRPLTPRRYAAPPSPTSGEGKKKKTPGKPRDEIIAFIDRSVKTKPKAQVNVDAEHAPSTYRLFYALRVPTKISNRLAEPQRKLKGNWRAVNPGQMHITLCYLPAVPPEKIDDLKRLGTRLMQDLPAMTVQLRGTGYFPNEGSPRVWFVKVEAEGLTELAEQLRAGVQELGVDTDNLPFKAHITLARKKGPAPRIPPLTFEELNWTATGGTLYRSILRKTGPIYEPQGTFRFRGNAPPESATQPPTPETQPDTQEVKE